MKTVSLFAAGLLASSASSAAPRAGPTRAELSRHGRHRQTGLARGFQRQVRRARMEQPGLPVRAEAL